MNKTIAIGILVVVVLAAIVGGAYYFTDRNSGNQTEQESMNENTTQASTTPAAADIVDLGGGLLIRDVKTGDGAEAVNGKRVYAKYVGRLTDGTVFDASELHPQTKDTGFSFVLGQDAVIQGWHKGIVGMKVGGQRLIQIPPELGYGAAGQGQIPPNATLIFAIELVKVE